MNSRTILIALAIVGASAFGIAFVLKDKPTSEPSTPALTPQAIGTIISRKAQPMTVRYDSTDGLVHTTAGKVVTTVYIDSTKEVAVLNEYFSKEGKQINAKNVIR